MSVFKELFQPIFIGPLEVKNRLLMSAMSINFGVDDRGWVNDQLIAYFRVRARGGAGMMLVGGGGVHPSGVEPPPFAGPLGGWLYPVSDPSGAGGPPL